MMRGVAGLLLWALVLGGPGGVEASDVPEPVYRVFLDDGTSIAAFGEWARVGDRVVFTITLGGASDPPVMHLASVPASRVDWPATERYRDGLRAATYAATRGDEDFAQLSHAVARLLNDAALAEDAGSKLAFAERARRLLIEWPAAHFGHRGEEVRQILALVEEVVSELRAARGETRFDLNLVAHVLPPALDPLPPPTLRESIAQALRLADLAESPADRISLLRSVSISLASVVPAASVSWASALRADVDRALRVELDLEARYSRLRTRALQEATRAAARADVRAVERAMATVRATDERLGGKRPDVMRSLMEALDERLDAARRLRLARDQWSLKAEPLQRYRDAARALLARLDRVRPLLDDIRSLAGPPAARLARLDEVLRDAQQRLGQIAVPRDAQAAHALATSAVQLAQQAAVLRRRAVETGAMQAAHDASAAAAGALMLGDRARAEVERVTRPPELP